MPSAIIATFDPLVSGGLLAAYSIAFEPANLNNNGL
jgi:hypothetical protein